MQPTPHIDIDTDASPAPRIDVDIDTAPNLDCDLDVERLAVQAREVGIKRVQVLAYRDSDDPAAGGSEIHAHEVLSRWAASGLQVELRTVACPGGAETMDWGGYRADRRGGRLTGVPFIALEQAHRMWNPWAASHRSTPDAVVEIWNGLPFFMPLWWRGPRLVVLHHLHDKLWDAFFPAPFSHLGRVLERRVAPRCYRRSPVATLAPSGREDLLARTALGPEGVHVVYPGVAPQFRPDPTVARSPIPLIVSVGRLTAAKRFDLVIETFSRLAHEQPDAELIIVGEGPERGVLEALIAKLGLHDQVQLAGRVPTKDLIDLYRRAWVIAAASVSEGWGMTLTEAAACGTPAVATNIIGHRDAVGVGAGLLADSDLEFESGLRKLVNNGAYRRMLSRQAEQAQNLTWERTAAGLLELLIRDAMAR